MNVKKSVAAPNPIDRLSCNPKSKALAIKAMCAHCVGCTQNSIERGYRRTIAECEVYHCPLHSFRPYASKTTFKSSQAHDDGVLRYEC